MGVDHNFRSILLVFNKLVEDQAKNILFFLFCRYNYTCVIYGWDPKCQASQEWIIQMGVDHLPKKHLQPFYNVLVEDGSNRYAAQGV